MRRWTGFSVAVLLSAALLCCEREERARVERSERNDDAPKELKIRCDLALEARDGHVLAYLAFTNEGACAVGMQDWRVIANGDMSWDAFEVMRAGERIVYLCKMVTWGKEGYKENLVLVPGETYRSKTDLSVCYDISEPGEYEVRYRAHYYSEDSGKFVEIVSDVEAIVVK